MTPTIEATPKLSCWFEWNDGKVSESLIRGFPDRIWSSKDPRWETLRAKKSQASGSIIVASVTRVGDEIFPRKYTPVCSFQKHWEQGLELMKKFESEGRLWDNTTADAVRAEEEKAERAQTGLATAIASAISGAKAPAGAAK